MMTWALIAVIAIGIANLFDLFDPDALELHYNSPTRAIVGLTAAIASLVTVLLVLGAGGWLVTVIILAVLLVAAIKAALTG